jgi:RNA polymerase sigma-70 factor (ECF subfamily)
MRFLARAWPHRDELDDIRQEAYVRVYEAATKALPRVPKAFLFTTARYLIIDRVRRSQIVSIDAVGGLGELEDLNVFLDEPSAETRANARQELRYLAVAFDALPPRCRAVLWLRRVEDLPQKAVARKLGMSERAVEKALARALILLTKNIHKGKAVSEVRRYGNEMKHGKHQSD